MSFFCMIKPPSKSPELHKRRFLSANTSILITCHTVQTWPPVIVICLEILSPHLLGTRLWDDDELKVATAWFGDQTNTFYFKGRDFLKEKWTKCTDVKGGYILKNNVGTTFQYVN